MKNFGYIFKLTAVLLIITVAVAGLLGLVNHLTEDKIAENTEKKAQEAMQSVLPSESYDPIELTKAQTDRGITKAYRCESGYVVRINAGGFGGTIDMMVGIGTDNKVCGISIVSHSETASLGSKCADAKWQESFISAAANTTGDLAVTKDGGTIEAITGATVTSRAVTEAVNVALAFVEEVMG